MQYDHYKYKHLQFASFYVELSCSYRTLQMLQQYSCNNDPKVSYSCRFFCIQGLHSASTPGILALDVQLSDTSKVLTGIQVLICTLLSGEYYHSLGKTSTVAAHHVKNLECHPLDHLKIFHSQACAILYMHLCSVFIFFILYSLFFRWS